MGAPMQCIVGNMGCKINNDRPQKTTGEIKCFIGATVLSSRNHGLLEGSEKVNVGKNLFNIHRIHREFPGVEEYSYLHARAML